jgi:hypothetical protein
MIRIPTLTSLFSKKKDLYFRGPDPDSFMPTPFLAIGAMGISRPRLSHQFADTFDAISSKVFRALSIDGDPAYEPEDGVRSFLWDQSHISDWGGHSEFFKRAEVAWEESGERPEIEHGDRFVIEVENKSIERVVYPLCNLEGGSPVEVRFDPGLLLPILACDLYVWPHPTDPLEVAMITLRYAEEKYEPVGFIMPMR